MKQLVLIVPAVLMLLCSNSIENSKAMPVSDTTPVTELTANDTLFAMAEAFAWVESRGNHMAYNEKEDAVGLLQIRPIMVREANRLIGEDAFTLADRWEPMESIDIFCTVMEHHNPKLDIDRAIDIWNPRCPASYRQSVKQEFAKALER